MPRIYERKILYKLPGFEKIKNKKGNLIRFEYRYVWTWRKVWIKTYPDKCGPGLGFESVSFRNTEMNYYYKWRIKADIEDILHGGAKPWILFSSGKTIFYSLAALVRKYCFCHEKIKFISSSPRVMFFLLYRQRALSI